ncbi:MAG: 2-C-methyl-D-erythritol 2,4-cyclodiphosphate synthase [Pelagibacterales bacterium]|nr:2-C-methyl-D-erythritol 2,4-cyclodiphosphate synthase [Pelagibacterales bacterium]
MNNCFIILAAGESKRFKSKTPKPYCLYRGKPIIKHSIDKAKESNKFKKIVIVVNKKHKKFIRNTKLKNIRIVTGGKNRSESSLKALKSLKNSKISKVFIHDAARPNFSLKLIFNLLKSLKNCKCVVPVLKTNNSVKLKEKNKLKNIDRNKIYLTQTPQAFHYKTLLNLQKRTTSKITDDANLFIESNKKVKFINGEVNNYKITRKSDVVDKKNLKYGIGFDVHRLIPKKKLYLGGLKIPSSLGTLGHSDGDPVLHAVTDSILGACKMGDIGKKFSNKNKKYKNIRSTILLKKIVEQIKSKNYIINNIDINIITQKPKISRFKNKMIQSISKICEISPDQINIKGKTTEKLGLIGKEKAIACEVITSVIKYA